MSKTTAQNTTPSCGGSNCLCYSGPRCRCHVYPPVAAPKATRDYNALLALALWDFGRMIRRRKSK